MSRHTAIYNISTKKRKNIVYLFRCVFVGTGDKFESFFKDGRKYLKDIDNYEEIFIFLAGQEKGISYIESLGIKVFCPIKREKGIFENQNISDTSMAIKIMQDLESKLKIPSEYQFGYGNSEALVSMIRTPDNTFPVFWWEGNVNGTPWPAPFPRR